MTLVSLAQVLAPARAGAYVVPGLVCLGWEDMRAYVAAAEAERAPVILQIGPGARAHTALEVLGAMLRHLGARASVPVVAHLDHGFTLQDCRAGLEAGFTSIMVDGSRLELSANIDLTAEVARLAHEAGASCEGEIGEVGYQGGRASVGTDPAEAARFARATGVDALAVSVGNLHLQEAPGEGVDLRHLGAIAAGVPVPLVLHGGSGIPPGQRLALGAQGVAKVNVGTELRQVFGAALRQALADRPDEFDRIALLSAVEPPLTRAARAVFRSFGASGRA